MQFLSNRFYHVYNQGNNRQNIFLLKKDYLTFLKLFRRLVLPFTEVLAWCLMPNHFHFLLYADSRAETTIKQGRLLIDPVTNGFRQLLSSYARIFNSINGRTGSLFRQKTKAKSLTDIPCIDTTGYTASDYLFSCFHHIHQNPFRAGLVHIPGDWEFSSYKDYAGERNGCLCNKQMAEDYGLYRPGQFILDSSLAIDEHLIKEINNFGQTVTVRPKL
jgi:putative transposase